MGIWLLQNVVLFRQSYDRVYIGERASSGYCVWLVGMLTIAILPVFLAYAAGGLWKKEAHYREQPLVRFQHEMAVTVQGDSTTAFWSTDPKLNDVNAKSVKVPTVRYSEIDYDTDGYPDLLNIKVSMPVTEMARRVFFAGSFSYQLSGSVRMVMKGMLAVDESCGVGASGVTLNGDLQLNQMNALRSLPEPRTIYDASPLTWSWNSNAAYTYLSPFSFPGLVESYSKRNETISLNRVLPPIWDFAPRAGGRFEMNLKVKVPPQVVYYVPGALEELKHAWVHIASFLVPVAIVVYQFLGFVFTNQVVQTYCCSQLPYSKKD